jgi:hypothetical protein
MIWVSVVSRDDIEGIVQTGPVYPLSVLASFLASFISSGESFRLLLVIIIVYASLGIRLRHCGKYC